MTYPHNLTLAEVSKKTYTCKKCSKEIKYAKFFKPDNTLLTVDGNEPNGKGMEKIDGKWVNHSNVFSTTVLVNEGNKLHECYDINWPDMSGVKIDESGLKQTNLLLDIPAQTDIDKKVLDKMTADSYQTALLLIAKYRGVKKACLDCKIDNPAVVGMLFNNLCAGDRHE